MTESTRFLHASTTLKQAIAFVVAFLLGLQFNPQFLWSDSISDKYSYSYDRLIDTNDAVDYHSSHIIESVSNTSSERVSVKEKIPPYLEWSSKKPSIPSNWTYVEPLYARTLTNFSPNPTKKIIVHYHMQHNAGTNFYGLAYQFTLATRACWQTSKHCIVSYNQEVEAENIRDNYKQHGLQYVSYEFMLPPRFPLPFVSETARDGLFFTTIMRNPMARLITSARHNRYKPKMKGDPPSNFWSDVIGQSGPYYRENLNVRWLSGAHETITEEHINIAKCRLQLFDLVIVDTMYDAAVNDVVCPLNNWEGRKYCNSAKKRREHISKKPNPFQETDSHFVGAWIERLRPSFELYDYARILSFSQLKERGVKDLPELSDVPSYIATLTRYTNATFSSPKHTQVSLKNIDRFHPPKEFCDEMKLIWSSNADEVPYFFGIGSLDPL